MTGNQTQARVYIQSTQTNEWWDIELAAPTGAKLAPGTYHLAERASFKTGRSPGIDVSASHRGCNTIRGSFSIRQITFDANGNIQAIEASFRQNRERPDAPVLAGSVHHDIAPMSLDLRSGATDYIGGSVKKLYFNDTSVFAIQGTASGLSYLPAAAATIGMRQLQHLPGSN